MAVIDAKEELAAEVATSVIEPSPAAILRRRMFRGLNTVNLDAKGRLAIPARQRDVLARLGIAQLVVTLNPWDRNLWLYPLAEWELIEEKLGYRGRPVLVHRDEYVAFENGKAK